MNSLKVKSFLSERYGCIVKVKTIHAQDDTYVVATFPLPDLPHDFAESLSEMEFRRNIDRDSLLSSPNDNSMSVKMTLGEWNILFHDLRDRNLYRHNPIFRTGDVRSISTPSQNVSDFFDYNPYDVDDVQIDEFGEPIIRPQAQQVPLLVCNKCSKEQKVRGKDFYKIYLDSKDLIYCKSCFEESFDKCDICLQHGFKDKFKNCDVCSQRPCDNCSRRHTCFSLDAEERDERRRMFAIAKENKIPLWALENPLKDVRRVFLKNEEGSYAKYLKHDRFVGTEIEVEKGKKFGLSILLPKENGIAHDGSLDESGIEIQTPPATLRKFEETLQTTCQVLKRRGYRGTIKCGLHIHLDARDFRNNKRKIVQVIKTFYSIEDMIFSILPPSRWTSKYCQKLSKDYLYNNFNSTTKPDEAWYKEEDKSILDGRKQRKYDKSRYYGLNVHSIFLRGTLELRYHSGTINEYKIIQWTNFALHVVDYALNHYKATEVEALFSMETSKNKFNFMCNLFKLPPELKEYLMSRIRKFNPDFNIKFNQGKEKRELEKGKISEINSKIELAIKEVKPKIIADIKNNFRRSGYENPEIDRTREFGEMVEEQLDRHLSKLFPKEYKIIPAESGFIKDEEIETITRYINYGRNLATNIDEESEG